MNALIVFNLAMVLLCGVTAAGLAPRQLYDSFLRGLHNTIGITTPSDRQLRWVLIVWLLSIVAIVDGLALMLIYVF